METDADRRSRTRTRVVDAATRLLQERGPAAVTTRAVAEGAGVQAPTIYRLFGDKDGLLDAVAEHVMTTYVAAKAAVVDLARADDVDPLLDLRAGWDTQVDFGLSNPTLFALLSDPDRGARSPAARSGQEILAARVQRLAAAGRLRVSEARAVDLIHAAGTGAVLTLLSLPVEQRERALPHDMLDAVLGRILTDPPAAPPDPVTTPVVAFRAVVPGLEGLSEAERTLLVEWLDRVLQRR